MRPSETLVTRARIAAVLFLLCIAPLAAADSPVLSTSLVVGGLGEPVFVTSPRGDFDRLFIVLKLGTIRIFDRGANQLRAAPFLDIASEVQTNGERGLLGLAFHPDYATNGFFYIYFIASPNVATLRRYHVSPDANLADAASGLDLLRVPMTLSNHVGGWVGFGRDGLLYVSIGENGASSQAQDIEDNLRGKVLRVDVNRDDFPGDDTRNYGIPPANPFVGVTGDDEIFVFGLRNPWRCSIDRLTGDLWIGDVGSARREEIDFVPAGSGGRNFGWPCFEGTLCSTTSCTCQTPQMLPPLFDYPRTGRPGGNGVMGGYVYRGCAMPALHGTYFFADLAGQLWSFRLQNGTVTGLTDRGVELGEAGGWSSWGEDAFGELYLCSFRSGGRVLKVVPVAGSPDCNANMASDCLDLSTGASTDCNGNGVPDECDISAGVLTDVNHNAVADLCEGLGDLNCDSRSDNFDINPFVEALVDPLAYAVQYPNCTPLRGDFNGDGALNDFDIDGFVLWIVR